MSRVSHQERARRSWKGPLHAGTLDLHHAVEDTPIGTAMSLGDPPKNIYVGWLSMKLKLHELVQNHVPEVCQRADRYKKDLQDLDERRVYFNSMNAFHQTLESEPDYAGAAYVLVGGELMGGRQLERTLMKTRPDLPRAWCTWESSDAGLALDYVKELRERSECIFAARRCFAALLDCCEEMAKSTP